MSTRATYQINGTTFYIYYDGYAAGAAGYFYNMVACDNKRGGYACQFLRGNDLAELTDSHEYHGDTEYRYTLEADGTLTVMTGYGEEWKKTFEGHFVDFCNMHGQILKRTGKSVMTTSDAVDKALSLAQDYSEWISQGMTVNASNKGIDALRIAMELDDTELLREVETICAKGRREYAAH